MLQFYRDTSKLQPARAEQMAIRVQRYSMLLRLLLVRRPARRAGMAGCDMAGCLPTCPPVL